MLLDVAKEFLSMAGRVGVRLFPGLLGLAVSLCLLSRPAQGIDEDAGTKVYKQALKSTVWIVVPSSEDTAKGLIRIDTGTGSVVNLAHGIVLTNYHVVGSSEKATVVFPIMDKGKLVTERKQYMSFIQKNGGYPGEVIAKDVKRDLALIKLKTPLPPGVQQLRLAQESASPGQRVHSVGNPGSSEAMWLYTLGAVRQIAKQSWSVSLGRRIHDFEARVLTTQSPTNPGDSGGPLLNDRGELVAVTQGGVRNAQQLSFFIDVTEVKDFLQKSKHLPTSSAVASVPEKPRTVPDKPLDDGQKAEQEAKRKLGFAKTLVTDGKTGRAKERLQEIVTGFPTTKAAGEAKLLLDELNLKK
jgi:S1-C subfamily serine protease